MLGWSVEFDGENSGGDSSDSRSGGEAAKETNAVKETNAGGDNHSRAAPANSFKPLFANGKCIVPFDSRLDELQQKFFSQLVTTFTEAVKHREVSGFEHTRIALAAISSKLSLAQQLSPEKARVARECALRSLAGFGVLDFLLAEPSLEEISVVGVGRPFFVYHRQLGWLKTNCFFTNFEEAVNAVNKMARPLGRRLAYQSPRINAVLPDGSRLHASIAPVCRNGVEITIRKFSDEPFSVASLAANATLSPEAAAALWLALYADVSLAVAGNTGSGKTTTLNSLFSFIPTWERIIVVEETPEIYLPHEHVVRLASNEELGVSLKDLVLDTLRMRPDRLVIGEIRSKQEAEAFIDCLLGGQARGSYCTLHAKSSVEALERLRALTGSSDGLSAIDLLLVQRRIPRYDSSTKRAWEARRVTEVRLQLNGQLLPLFKHDFASDSLKKCDALERLFDRLTATYSASAKELRQEFEARAQLLEKLSKQKISFSEFTAIVQQHAYSKKPA